MAWKRRSPTPWARSMSSSTDFRSLACAPQPGVSPAKHAGTRRSPADCDAPSARKSPPDQRHDPSGASRNYVGACAACCGPGRGGRSHQPLGLFQVEGLRFRTPQGMLQAEAIEHVAFGAATAPGVLEQSADVAEILGQAAFGAATLALGFKPMQIILQRKMP